MSLAAYMALQGADAFRVRLVDAVVCNDRCTSAARAGLREQLYADYGASPCRSASWRCSASRMAQSACDAPALFLSPEWPHGDSEIYPIEGLSRFGEDLARTLPIFCGGRRTRLALAAAPLAVDPVLLDSQPDAYFWILPLQQAIVSQR